jgi:hypothetical protein
MSPPHNPTGLALGGRLGQVGPSARPDSAPRAAPGPGSSPGLLYSHRRVPPISRIAASRGPDSRFPAESGSGGFPDSRFPADRESEIPSPFPGHWQIGNRGNGNWGFPGLLAAASLAAWQWQAGTGRRVRVAPGRSESGCQCRVQRVLSTAPQASPAGPPAVQAATE